MNFFKYQDFISTSRTRAPTLATASERSNSDPRNPLQTAYDSTNDELWIESWLSQIVINKPSAINPPKPKPPSKLPPIPINLAKESLKKCLTLLNKLRRLQSELEDNVETVTSAVWKQKTIEIGYVKDEFTKLMAKFESADAVSHLKRSIDKRKRKRLRQNLQRQHRRIVAGEQHEKRLKLHKDIDQWLAGMKEEAEKLKMEENMKKDADCVLSEVTKKKSEARKQLSLVSALVKLRSVRETMASQRGEKTSLEDRQAFNITTEKLVKMWENSLKTYNIEEQGMRLMLEKTAQNDSKAAKLAKERKLLEEWQNVLFGSNPVDIQSNPTFWALTAAERDLETFIAIRKSWDTFLVPATNEMGSKIPIGWVLPGADAMENWNKYLQHS